MLAGVAVIYGFLKFAEHKKSCPRDSLGRICFYGSVRFAQGYFI